MKLTHLLKLATSTPLLFASFLLAPSAQGCGVQGVVGAALKALAMHAPAGVGLGRHPAAATPGAAGGPQVVGMWSVTFYVGSTSDVWDQAWEQFYADGNEMTNDIAVPPAVGNICFGVWTQAGGRTFKLKHYGWNFDSSGNFAGTFVLTATIEADSQGNSFTGSYVADSYDTSNQIIPADHGEGIMKGTAITVD